jgi:DNA polymerase-3 subunit gamma/tau
MPQFSVALRPASLDSFIGNPSITAAIAKQLSERIPVAILLTGEPGVGKTTLSKIIARMVNPGFEETDLDIKEVNGSSDNGIDAIRDLIEQSRYRPLSGHRRVIIVNEAQGLTSAAKQALLDRIESTDETTLWIFTSMALKLDKDDKLDKAFRRRCVHYSLKLMSELEIRALVQRAAENTKSTQDTAAFITHVVRSRVGSPGEILAAWELYSSGTPLADCITAASYNADYRDIASAVLRGDWNVTRGMLEKIPLSDSRGLRAMVSGYLRSALLKSEAGAKADALSSCMVGLGSVQFEDGVAHAVLCSLLYKCCKQLGGK